MPDLPAPGKDAEKEVGCGVKPKGISLPTTEMTYDWMDDDVAMGTISTDDDEEVEQIIKKENANPTLKTETIQKAGEAKMKGISLPITEITNDLTPKKDQMKLNLTQDTEVTKDKNEVTEQFSPVQYWRDPIPDIADLEAELKASEKPKPMKTVKPKEKNWLASNMAGMFDRKPKPKPKTIADSVGVTIKKGKENNPVDTTSLNTTKSVKKDNVKRNVESKTVCETSNKEEKSEEWRKYMKTFGNENVWQDKWKCDDAEKKFYEKENKATVDKSGEESAKPTKTSTSEKKAEQRKENLKNLMTTGSSEVKTSVEKQPRGRVVKEITEEIHEIIEVTRTPEKMETSKLKEKISSVEAENKKMKKILEELGCNIKELTSRVAVLEERDVSH